MQNVFAGLRTGAIVWLAEADLITDDLPLGGERDMVAGLVEANWLYRRGHNLKISLRLPGSRRRDRRRRTGALERCVGIHTHAVSAGQGGCTHL